MCGTWQERAREWPCRFWAMTCHVCACQGAGVACQHRQHSEDCFACTAVPQGHLTNAAFWGPEQHSSSSSDGDSSTTSSKSSGRVAAGDSSSAGGGATSDPSQQPVWTLHQLFDVIGQQQADSVWQQICETAGEGPGQAVGKPRCNSSKQSLAEH
jgi:hypothetical protein